MPSTTNIPNALRQVGTEVYGPVTLEAPDSEITVNLDRTPNQGLNARTSATKVTTFFELMVPGDPNWYEIGRATFEGGSRTDPDTGVILATDYLGMSLWNPGTAGRQIRCTLIIAGSSVRLAGTVVVV